MLLKWRKILNPLRSYDLPDAEVEKLQKEAVTAAAAPRGRGHQARVRNVLYNEEWEMH